MRYLLACVVGLTLVLLAWTGHGERSKRTRSPDGRHRAEVRPRPVGGDGVFVDDKQVWPEPGRRQQAKVVTPVVWSRQGDAVALVAREDAGTTLVVAIVDGEAAGKALTWALPEKALPARAVTWLGPTKVAVGPAEMQPKVVASWSVAR